MQHWLWRIVTREFEDAITLHLADVLSVIIDIPCDHGWCHFFYAVEREVQQPAAPLAATYQVEILTLILRLGDIVAWSGMMNHVLRSGDHG
jgi:hypothetical protein